MRVVKYIEVKLVEKDVSTNLGKTIASFGLKSINKQSVAEIDKGKRS